MSFTKTISVRQTEVVDEKLTKLQKIANEYDRAMNKNDVKRNAFKVIAELEKMFARMEETVETGWSSLQKKYRHFSDFDLTHKHKKRASKHAKCETLTVQIKDQIAELLLTTLVKLDSNISSEDRKALKVIQKETQEF